MFSIFWSFSAGRPGRGLIVLFCGLFCYFFIFISVTPPGNFSADALVFMPLKFFQAETQPTYNGLNKYIITDVDIISV